MKKLYKTLSDIKSEVEYVIRTGRGIVEKRQIDEPNDLTKQIDKLKAQYNTLGAKVSLKGFVENDFFFRLVKINRRDDRSRPDLS